MSVIEASFTARRQLFALNKAINQGDKLLGELRAWEIGVVGTKYTRLKALNRAVGTWARSIQVNALIVDVKTEPSLVRKRLGIFLADQIEQLEARRRSL